jgi:hypothetical protein
MSEFLTVITVSTSNPTALPVFLSYNTDDDDDDDDKKKKNNKS